jgi:asparagine N-glycosylation enzyme membrane subunit Stt3
MYQAANPNPMGSVFLVGLIVLTCIALIGGKGAKWKLLNLLIIIGFMATGLLVGFALGAWGGSAEIGGHAAASLTILLGCVGAFGCIRRNKRREPPQT